MSSLSQGIHNATCIGVIFIGEHPSINGIYPKVTILWEVFENGIIKTTSRDYTFSYYETAKLRLHLESWRGRPFTKDELSKFKLCNILGVPCKLEIRKNSKGLKQVENIYRFPRNEEAPLSQTKYIYFDIADEKTYQAFADVPEYIQAKIKQSPEYKQSQLNKVN